MRSYQRRPVNLGTIRRDTPEGPRKKIVVVEKVPRRTYMPAHPRPENIEVVAQYARSAERRNDAASDHNNGAMLTDGDKALAPAPEHVEATRHPEQGQEAQGQPNPDFLQALENATRFNGSEFFHNQRERRTALLVQSNILLVEMIKGGDAAIDLAIERLPPDLRQRAPSKKKPELIALQVTAKPETEAHLKTLYGYAPVLFVAQARGLSPDAFREWVPDVNLDDCKVQATKIRAALKAGAPVELDEPEATLEEPWLEIR